MLMFVILVGATGLPPVVSPVAHMRVIHLSKIRMGIFEEGFQSAFEAVKATVDGVRAAYDDDNFIPEGFVRAHHILFLASDDAERKADAVRNRIEAGDFTFFEAATSFSACPTRDLQGNLGTFSSLSRVREGTLRGRPLPYEGKDTSAFDTLVFAKDTPLNTIFKVKTQWGVHLVIVTSRGARGAQTGFIEQAQAVMNTFEMRDTRSPGVEDSKGFARTKTRKGGKKPGRK